MTVIDKMDSLLTEIKSKNNCHQIKLSESKIKSASKSV